jgi:hypothetical protein
MRKTNAENYARARHHDCSCPAKVRLNRGSTGGQITGIFSQKMQSARRCCGLKEVLQRRALLLSRLARPLQCPDQTTGRRKADNEIITDDSETIYG